jgi:hypothetical protein
MQIYDTIDQPTLDLLRRLQAAQEFAGMRLVGGTSLALQIGHRKSIKVDIVNYPYPWLEAAIAQDGLFLASIKDIKYDDGSEFMVLKGLLYFDDADLDPMPVTLEHVEWEAIKKRVKLEVKNLL